jgi:acyl transferase domain-containing protein
VDVITAALRTASVHPDTIGYVEAHGTGTALGDPIEIAALTEAFRTWTKRRCFCAVGSVKTNIGHLDTAAGIAGLIKTALALKAREIPRILHFRSPNPRIDFDGSPFFVAAEARPWEPSRDGPRRAGVSAFGAGGTNVHLLLEEAPPCAATRSTGPLLLTLSARTPRSLDGLRHRWIAALRRRPGEVADLCFTATRRRSFAANTLSAVGDSANQLADQLESADPVHRKVERRRQAPRVLFMFPGQGAQAPQMGAELLRWSPAAAEEVARIDRTLAALGEEPASRLLSVADDRIDDTRRAQVAILSVELALAAHWINAGVEPAALIGHSVGEYAAACVAGVFSLEDVVRLVVHRAKLMDALPREGAMLAVFSDAATVRGLLGALRLEIAAYNAPRSVVVAGRIDDIAAFERVLEAERVPSRRFAVSHAFHCFLMEPMLEPFRREAERVAYREPRLPIYANLSGAVDGRLATAGYWVEHVRAPVRFADGLAAALPGGVDVALEVGPGKTLSQLGRSLEPSASWIAGLNPRQAARSLLEAAAQLHHHGSPVRWARLQPGRTVHAPTYAFDEASAWLPPTRDDDARRPLGAAAAALERGDVTALVDLVGDPSPTARRLFEALVAADRGAAAAPPTRIEVLWRPAPSPPTAASRRRWDLLGDERDVAALARIIHDGACRGGGDRCAS